VLADEERGLLRREAERQAVARQLVDGLQLLQRWQAYGQPVLCGALAYGLLVAPDIDLEVFGPPDIDAGFALMSRWAHHPRVRRVRFTNELDSLHKGLYWQLRMQHHGQLWKVDMWLLPNDHPGPRSCDLVEPLRQALDDTTRATILRIKEALVARSGGPHDSIDLYRAVLDDGVATLPEFDAWRANHASTALSAWRPHQRRNNDSSPSGVPPGGVGSRPRASSPHA
jgi:hypothetical protein